MGITFQPVTALQTNMRVIEGDFKSAKVFGHIRVGKEFLFYQNLMDVLFIPIKEITWGYLRHGVSSGCALVLVTHNGSAKKFPEVRALHAQEALQYLRRLNPAVLVGYAEEQVGVFA